VQALCSHGATINVVNSVGETPVQLAEKAGNSDAAAQILQAASRNRAHVATTAAAAIWQICRSERSDVSISSWSSSRSQQTSPGIRVGLELGLSFRGFLNSPWLNALHFSGQSI
jgi:ankyrin repeat protein